MNAASAPSLSNLSSIDLNLLVMLDAIITEESVTLAAQRVSLSQPAMSHALARLRRLLGDDLLIRNGARSRLTPKAERLRGPLREVLRRTADLLDDGDFDPATDTREVIVGMTSSTTRVIGGALAGMIAQEAPGMRLRVLSAQRLTDAMFTQAGVDVLLVSETHETRHPRERLYEDEWVVISGHPDLADATARELVSTQPHVVYGPLLSRRPYQALREAGIAWTTQTTVDDTLILADIVAATSLVAVHRRRVVDTLRIEGLRTARFPVDAGVIGMDLVWNPWTAEDPFRAWMRDLLRRAIPAYHSPGRYAS